ncbi:hypothetical protein CAEBREN_15891 [Caenorhabditis brenneri]|uniref:Uncharacterized protein n=1 Tax=Caenorhabditis brenneri TaxID=135651 RepID=G0ND46_CAEBE|nr:hypothetical protein CAEBREN_15891 [Caenorhabditis brenneri]
MYEPPSQPPEELLDPLTQAPKRAAWENLDDPGWSRTLEDFIYASIDVFHLDGTFTALPIDSSTGLSTVENHISIVFPSDSTERDISIDPQILPQSSFQPERRPTINFSQTTEEAADALAMSKSLGVLETNGIDPSQARNHDVTTCVSPIPVTVKSEADGLDSDWWDSLRSLKEGGVKISLLTEAARLPNTATMKFTRKLNEPSCLFPDFLSQSDSQGSVFPVKASRAQQASLTRSACEATFVAPLPRPSYNDSKNKIPQVVRETATRFNGFWRPSRTGPSRTDISYLERSRTLQMAPSSLILKELRSAPRLTLSQTAKANSQLGKRTANHSSRIANRNKEADNAAMKQNYLESLKMFDVAMLSASRPFNHSGQSQKDLTLQFLKDQQSNPSIRQEIINKNKKYAEIPHSSGNAYTANIVTTPTGKLSKPSWPSQKLLSQSDSQSCSFPVKILNAHTPRLTPYQIAEANSQGLISSSIYVKPLVDPLDTFQILKEQPVQQKKPPSQPQQKEQENHEDRQKNPSRWSSLPADVRCAINSRRVDNRPKQRARESQQK